MRKVVYLFLLSILPMLSIAQIDIGNSVAVLHPINDFGDSYKTGYGIFANAELKIPIVSITGEFGWGTFVGKDIDDGMGGTIKVENIDNWVALLGVKWHALGPAYIEFKGGWLFDGIDDLGLMPGIGVRLKNFDLGLSYNFKDPATFGSLKLIYYWVNKKKD